MILAEKPTIADDTHTLEPALLDQLIGQIATLASIYHKAPETFVVRSTMPMGASAAGEEDDYDGDYLDGTGADDGQAPPVSPQPGAGKKQEVDLLDLGSDTPPPPPSAQASAGGNLLDLLGGGPTPSPGAPASGPSAKVLVCPAQTSQGVEIYASTTNRGGQPIVELDVRNLGPTPLTALAIKFNVNTFGLTPVDPTITFPSPVPTNASAPCVLPLALQPAMVDKSKAPNLLLQTAVKNMASGFVFYFTLPVSLEALYAPSGQIDRTNFTPAWRSIDDSLELSAKFTDLPPINVDALLTKLTAKNLAFVARRPCPSGGESVYLSAVTVTQPPVHFLLELTLQPGMPLATIAVKTQVQAFAPLALASTEALLRR